MIPAVYVPLDQAPPVAMYESSDKAQALWLLPIQTDAGPVFLQHLLTPAGQDDVFFRYGLIRDGDRVAVVYTGPFEIPSSDLQVALPEMVRAAIHDEAHPIISLWSRS